MTRDPRRPLVAEIKRNSLDDGPGIRSVVFFKGCLLRCVWCHNPECIRPEAEVLYRQAQCMGRGACAEACPEGAIGPGGPSALDRERCTLCGACVDECPTGALSLVGTWYEPGDLVRELARDRAFYDNSGGGVTLSGGEPTLFLEYTAELAAGLRQEGIRVLLETCGDFPWEPFRERLLPLVDPVFVDLKLCDATLHRRYTGRDNERIQRNIRNLVRLGTPEVLVRIPLVPGVTATPENLRATAAWLAAEGVRRIALLPYNPLWLAKARGLGRSPDYERASWMSAEEREAVKAVFRGFEITRDL